jgi:hypothetical protein
MAVLLSLPAGATSGRGGFRQGVTADMKHGTVRHSAMGLMAFRLNAENHLLKGWCAADRVPLATSALKSLYRRDFACVWGGSLPEWA